MNDSLRRKNKIQVAHEEKLEQAADVILRQMATNSTPIRNVTTTKKPIPEANVFLKTNAKTDKLAIKATKILQELSF